LPSWFAKLLEANFSCFAKIIWMPSWFAKLFELLSDAASCCVCCVLGSVRLVHIWAKKTIVLFLYRP
jgi:hypothetical protein